MMKMPQILLEKFSPQATKCQLKLSIFVNY